MGGSKPGGPQSKKLPKRGPGRPKGALNKTTRAQKEWAEAFLTSEDYREAAKRRVMGGKASHLETLWYHHAFGVPKQTMEVSEKRVTIFREAAPKAEPE